MTTDDDNETTDDDSREQGVEFGHLADDLADLEYPTSKSDLLDQFGDREVQLEDGSQTLREILEPVGEDSFESAEDVKRTVVGLTGDEAVGRKKYSDRGGAEPPTDDDEYADESF